VNILSLIPKFFLANHLLSIFSVLLLSFSTLGLPCFAVSGYTAPFVRSMSFSLRFISSIGLSPVSFDIEMANASLGDALEIIKSIFASSGILGIFEGT